MTDIRDSLGTPGALAPERAVAHRAVQLLTAAARANLKPEADDSHSNLEWSPGQNRFLCHPLPCNAGSCQVGLAPTALMLEFSGTDIDPQYLALPGRRYGDALAWLDERLTEQGLEPASGAKIPYDLPPDVAAVDAFPSGRQAGLSALAKWYSLAVSTLTPLAESLSDLKPGPSPIRCWPHHFDIATYVALETGDAETARGIGVGLAPGDDAYPMPYFYVNPWPHPDPASLSAPIAPGHWHTEGFVGAVATGEEILTLEDVEEGTAEFLRDAFEAGRSALLPVA